MKRKVLFAILALAITMQSTVMAEATHKHVWADDVAGSDETTNRYYCECGATKDELIADIRNPIVTFDANGGYVAEPQKETYKGRIKWLPIPEHTSDYQWEGWFTEPTGGVLVDEKYIYEEDTTLYAQWTIKGTRTLKFASDEGSYIRPITKKYGETISLEGYIPKREGYIFKGWYEDPTTKEIQVTEYTFTQNDVLYAKWEADPNSTQPDTLLTRDPAYLTDEEYKERTNRLKAILEEMLRVYFKNIQSIEGGPKGSPLTLSWRAAYGN